MSKNTYLRLKPLSVQFSASIDCPYQSSFTATIEYGDTVFKSGIFKAHREMAIQLANLSWIQFQIQRGDLSGFVYICLKSQPQQSKVQLKTSSITIIRNQAQQSKQYTSLLSVEELLRNPANKKKRFVFPLMYEGQIKAQAQFKLFIRGSKLYTDHRLFKQINLQQKIPKNIKKSNSAETEKKPQKHKNHSYKPIVSQTCIVITPDLFVKKQAISLPQIPIQFQSKADYQPNDYYYNQQSYKSPSFSSDITQNQDDIDLLIKFEQLNAKYSQQCEKQNIHNNSVWEQVQESKEKSYKKAISLNLFNYGIIDQQTESDSSQG